MKTLRARIALAVRQLSKWHEGVNGERPVVSLRRIGLAVPGMGILSVIILIWVETRTVAALKRRQALNHMLDDLQVGASREDVYEVFLRRQTSDLVMRELSTNAWVIDMPPDWASRPMRLYVDFFTGRVSRLGIRFQDDTNVRPREASADKGVR